LAALEVAHRLEISGRSVKEILLIDTFSINARPLMQVIVPFVGLASWLVPGGLGRRIRRSGMPSLWRLASHLLAGDHAIARRVTRTIRTGKMRIWDTSRRTAYYRAMSKFVPPKIHARLICLLSNEYRPRNEYATDPWKSIASDVTSHAIPGDHSTCISRHVVDLAACMNRTMFAESRGQPAPHKDRHERTEII
jgi:thioesterase domain-containing protein